MQNIEIHAKFTDLEWQARQRLLDGLRAAEDQEDGSTTNAASPWMRMKGDEIMMRNRYMNVDPYAGNRVRLNVPTGECDYINASPIVLSATSGREKRYIATQVCLIPLNERKYNRHDSLTHSYRAPKNPPCRISGA
jgi:protein-tyrosine phosphatase